MEIEILGFKILDSDFLITVTNSGLFSCKRCGKLQLSLSFFNFSIFVVLQNFNAIIIFLIVVYVKFRGSFFFLLKIVSILPSI